MNKIGIRSEEKHWDSRVTISPDNINNLPESITLYFQNDGERKLPFKNRVFSNSEILEAGESGGAKTQIASSLKGCDVIIGTKEIKEAYLKIDETQFRFLTEILQNTKTPFPELVLNKRRSLAQLTDFLSKEQKVNLLNLTENTPVEKLIKQLLTEQNNLIEQGKTYVFFSHTHKGQSYNMRMLQEFINKKCTLIDYELMRDGASARTVSYGNWAGTIGVLDTLWAFGEHLYLKTQTDTPFRKIRDSEYFDPIKCEYRSIELMKRLFSQIAEEIKQGALPFPLTIGITGFKGKVGNGALEALENWGLPIEILDADDFIEGASVTFEFSSKKIYLLKLEYQHLYRAKSDLNIEKIDIRQFIKSGKGSMLQSNMDKVFPRLNIFLNCIVWNTDSPRILTNSLLKRIFEKRHSLQHPVLPVIGDITCDPNGSIQCCRDTYPNSPVYVWSPGKSEEPILPDTDLKKVPPSYKYFDLNLDGFVVMAVTNLPCEIPRESSMHFSRDFCTKRTELNNKSYLECLAEANFNVEMEHSGLPEALKNAVILYKGKFNSQNKQLFLKDICLAMIKNEILQPEQILEIV